ncbi:MAG: hypothetical protein ABIT23_09825, partial [Nitrosospira sp.]
RAEARVWRDRYSRIEIPKALNQRAEHYLLLNLKVKILCSSSWYLGREGSDFERVALMKPQ